MFLRIRARRAGLVLVTLLVAAGAACRAADTSASQDPTVPGSSGPTGTLGPSESVSPSPSPEPEPSPSPEPEPTLDVPSQGEMIEGTEVVRFRAGKGVRLAGRLFGSGRVGVVLAHMGPSGSDQSSWWWMARILADRGHTVLTFNFRGICPRGPAGCSGGQEDAFETSADVRAAMAFLRCRGHDAVVLGGASIGAMASVTVAAERPPGLLGVISLAGVEFAAGYDIGRETIERIEVPALYASGKYDRESADSARHWYRFADAPAELRLFDSAEHGTDMIRYPGVSAAVRRSIVRFVDTVADRA